jgi:hypothetical protein
MPFPPSSPFTEQQWWHWRTLCSVTAEETSDMAVLLAEFDTPILTEALAYRARVFGAPMDESLWEGWIEFVPVDGGSAVRTPRETTQPNATDTEYWATGLTTVYLEGALARALDRTATSPRER